jgi:hypothetical protein
MAGNLVEHVIKKPQAVLMLAFAAAIQIYLNSNVGF